MSLNIRVDDGGFGIWGCSGKDALFMTTKHEQVLNESMRMSLVLIYPIGCHLSSVVDIETTIDWSWSSCVGKVGLAMRGPFRTTVHSSIQSFVHSLIHSLFH